MRKELILKMNEYKKWKSSRYYNIGDIVLCDGSLYEALFITNRTCMDWSWKLLKTKYHNYKEPQQWGYVLSDIWNSGYIMKKVKDNEDCIQLYKVFKKSNDGRINYFDTAEDVGYFKNIMKIHQYVKKNENLV